MSRNEFSKETKRLAHDRSGGKCEARGKMYGLDRGKRCNMPFDRGVEYDHVNMDAMSHDNSLENCAAVCRACHRWKTDKFDKLRISKADRASDFHRNVKQKTKFQIDREYRERRVGRR